MGEKQKEELRVALRHHEHEAARLSHALARFVATGQRDAAHPEVFFAAQLTRHRISIALIASRLREPQPAR